MMRKLLAVIVVAALAWGGYWFLGARGAKAAMSTWLDDRRAEGWQVEYTDHTVRGFPNRFDTTLTNLELTDPETGLSWQAPFFQILSLSYKPNHLIAVWPNEQVIATPENKLTLKTEDMRASLIVKPSTALELDRANVVMTNATMQSTEGWQAGFDSLNAAIRENGTPASYDVAVDIATLIPGEKFRKIIDRGGSLPDQIEALRLDIIAALAAPLDRIAIEDGRPAINALTVNDLRGTWGELDLRAKGQMDVSASGSPDGELAVTARNWREMLALAVQAGAIDESSASAVELGLGFLASATGNGNSLDATLSFSGGRTFLGPIPVAKAPTIKLP